MKQHVNILGWTYIILGAFGILLAILVGLFLVGIGIISGDQTASNVLLLVALFVSGVSALLSIPGVIAGIGLLGTKRWARVLTIILGIMNLPAFPIGTLLGAYSLYVMLDDETSALF